MSDLDHLIFRAIFAHGGTGPLMTLAWVFSALGTGWSLLALVPLFFDPRARPFARALLVALVLTAVAVYSLKATFARPRPHLVLTDLAPFILGSPTDPSFPSGHAAGSSAFALFTVHCLLDKPRRSRLAWIGAVACVLFAACVGVSRVILGAHFPGDVLGGTILGATIGGAAGRSFMLGTSRRPR